MSEGDDVRAELEQLRERVDALEGQRRQQNSLIKQFAGKKISRRTFLAATGGLAGGYVLAERAAAAPSWGSATGQIGTDSTPLTEVNSKRGHFQSVQAEQVSISEGAVRIEQTTDQSIPTGSTTQVKFDTTAVSRGGSVLSADTANNVITTNTAGVYLTTARVKMNFNNDGTKLNGLLEKGTTAVDLATNITGAATNLTVGMSAAVEVSAPPTDISVSVLHSHGSSRSTISGSSTVHLDVVRIL